MRSRGRPPHPDILTPREWEVLALLREGLSNTQIAQRLGISHAGAKYHVQEILSKLGVSKREEAARWSPEAVAERRPWWTGALAFIWRKAPGPAAYVAGGLAAVAALGGLGLLAFLLMRGGGTNAGGAKLPLVLGGDSLGISALDGNPPVALTGPGDYSGAVVGADGVLRYFQRTGATGFYEMNGASPKLIIPVQPVSGAYFGEWSPDGSMAAWIEPSGNGTSVLRVAEAGGTPRTLGPEGLASFLWSADSKQLLAWPNGAEIKTYLIDTSTGDTQELGSFYPLTWSSTGDFVVREPSESPSGDLVLMHPDGSGRRVLGQQYIPYEGGNTKVTFSPDGRWLAWDAGVQGDGSALFVATVDGSGTIIPSCAPDPCIQPGAGPAWSPDGSRLAWSEDGHIYVAETGIWEGHAVAEGAQPAWSPDGARIAYVRGQQPPLALYVKPSDGSGTEVKVVDAADTRAFAFQIAWWPDGSRMAVTLQAPDVNRAVSFDLKTGELRDLPFSPDLLPVLAPDGSALAYAAGNAVTVISPDGTSRSIEGLERTGIADWSRDGKRLLLVGGVAGGLSLLDLRTEKETSLVDGNVQDAVLSPDGKRAAYIRDQRLHVLDIASGQSRELAPALSAMLASTMLGSGYLAWSPDGKQIAVGDWKLVEPVTQGQSDIYAVDAASGEARRLTGSPRAKRYFSWSPDGRYVAYLNTLDDGDHLRVVEAATGKELPLDTNAYLSSAPQWVSNDTLLVNGPAGISFVKVDGTSRLVVQGARPCSYSLLGLAKNRLYFTMRCSHGGL
jgi:Tol biopolymer transport system component/DNA-binding CsgD family transcriptional regulator